MGASVIDTVSAQLEQVATDIPEYYDFDLNLAGTLKPAKWAEVTRYLYRIPYIQYPGGSRQKYISNRGDMGSGSGMKMSKLTAGFIDSLISFEMSLEQIQLSQSSAQSRINVMAKTTAEAMNVLNAHDNIDLHGDGTGKLTNASSSQPASTQLVFAGTTDNLGVNMLFDGMVVDVWDSVGTTLRANGPYKIETIDTATKTVTFSSAPTGLSSGDLLAVANVDEYGPAAPTSFSSTWPGGGTTDATGLTGDSWRHGLRYCNDATLTNYYLGKLKSGVPKLVPIRINAASAMLTFGHVELGKNLLIQKRSQEALNGLIGVTHSCQIQQLKDIGITISTWMRGAADKMIDVMPKGKYTEIYNVADLPLIVSKVQPRDRVDYFNPKNWGRVESEPAKFYKNPEGGSIFFPLRSSTTANLVAGWEFKIIQKFDWACNDPGASFFIDTLGVITGY